MSTREPIFKANVEVTLASEIRIIEVLEEIWIATTR